MSTFETTPQTGPGSTAWNEYWDTVEEDRTYLSEGYRPSQVARAAEILGAVAVSQEA